MYLSRITLHTGQLSPAQLLHLVDRGEYVMHQWLWIFSWRQTKAISLSSGRTPGRVSLFVLSQERPAESDTFTIECRSFAPSCVPDNNFVSTCGRIQQSVKRQAPRSADGGETAGEGTGGRK
ncbi:type I-E CRISPR-associated protein Cas6/Cse3/CasE [Escherichia coli]